MKQITSAFLALALAVSLFAPAAVADQIDESKNGGVILLSEMDESGSSTDPIEPVEPEPAPNPNPDPGTSGGGKTGGESGGNTGSGRGRFGYNIGACKAFVTGSKRKQIKITKSERLWHESCNLR